MRRRLSTFVLGILVIVAAIAAGADLASRVIAEHQIASTAKSSTGAKSAGASIHSFPFLYRLLLDSEARRVDVHLRGVPAGPLRLDRVDVTAAGVRIERAELIEHRRARLTGVDRLTARVTVTAADLSAATGLDIAISGDHLTGSFAGLKVTVTAASDGHVLTLTALDHKVFSFDLARDPIVPPCDMQLSAVPDGLTLSCSVSPVPASVIEAMSAAP